MTRILTGLTSARSRREVTSLAIATRRRHLCRFGTAIFPENLGRFVITRLLGEGAFGKVYLAQDPLLDRSVALKAAKLDHADSSHRIKRFLREAKVAASLRHPHIVPLYEFGQDGDRFFITSAFIPGRTLKDAIEEAKTLAPHPSPLDPHRAARIIRQMAEALAYAHEQGIVHRDIKPANTMLDDKDEPMIMDFGLATRQEGAEELTHAGQVLGTPLYMAPEQARGKDGAARPASDQYSLGIILYELLTGKRPFEGTTELVMHHHQQTEPPAPRKVNPLVPRDLETICLKCLEKDPTRRYADCRALAEDLRRWLADEAILARKVGAGERLVRWCRKNPYLAVATGLAAAALIGVTVVSVSFAVYQKEAQERSEKSRKEIEKNQYDTQLQAAQLAVERGQSFAEQGDVGRAMLYLARGLELAPNDVPDLHHYIRMNLGACWSQHIPVLDAVDAGGTVEQFVLSPDRRLVATTVKDQVRLWEAQTGKPFGSPMKLEGRIEWLRFSTDGKTLAAGNHHQARTWDLATAQSHGITMARTPQVLQTLSPDLKTLAECSFSRVLLSEATSRRPLGPAIEHDISDIRGVYFSRDVRTLAIGGRSKIALWELPSLRLLGSFVIQEKAAYARGFYWAPDFQSVVVVGEEELRFYELPSGRLRGRPLKLEPEDGDTALSPDGKVLAIGSEKDKNARLWEVASGKELGPSLQHHQSGRVSVAFRPDGKVLGTTGGDGIRLSELPSGKPIGMPLQIETAYPPVFSPDGAIVSAVGFDGKLRLWDASTTQPLAAPLERLARHADFSSDGKTLISTSSTDENVWFWDLSRRRACGFPLPHRDAVDVVLFSPDGRTLATRAVNRTRATSQAQLWDAATGRPLSGPPERNGDVGRMAFSPDGRLLAVGGDDLHVHFWDVSQGEPGREPISDTHYFAFSPDGKIVATAGFETTWFKLWDISVTSRASRRFQHVERPQLDDKTPAVVRTVAFSPGSGETGMQGREVSFWEVPTGKRLDLPWRDQRWVWLSPDGKTAATTPLDRTARLWDLATGKALGPPLTHLAQVSSCAFSPDGKQLATCSNQVPAYGRRRRLLREIQSESPCGLRSSPAWS